MNRMKAVGSGGILVQEEIIQPVVFSGVEGQKGVYFFDDEFDRQPIQNLINAIEQFKQMGYAGIDLYFQSNGGDVTCLMMLADYINNLPEGFELTIVVNGQVASAGFYTLLMVERANIVILDSAHGMVHIGGCHVSSYSMYGDDKPKHDYDKFRSENIKKLNDFITENYLNKIDIDDEDRKHLADGKDLYFHADELRDIINKYHDIKFFESEEFKSHIDGLETQIANTEALLELALDEYEDVMGKPFYEQEDECDCNSECEECLCKVGGTD